jgi:hypothetical protein
VPDAPLQIVEIAAAALAGPAAAMAAASRTGHVAAADDRGELGLWDASGERVLTLRLDAPAVDLDVAPDGSRIAVRTASGECVVVEAKSGSTHVTRLEWPGLVRLDPHGDGMFCVATDEGRVEAFNAWGKRIAAFDVPSPVSGCVVHPRDKGLLVATRSGVVARFTPWGEQVWAVDLGRHAGAASIDARGTLLVVVGYGRGADGIAPDDGRPLGAFDVARSIEAVAVARQRVLVGTNDGRLVLLDRAAGVCAESRTGAKPLAVALRDDARHAAARLDDGTVRLYHTTSVAADPPRRSRLVGGAPEGRFPPREALRRRIFAAGAFVRQALIALSPCGRMIATTSEGRRVLLLRRDGDVAHDARHEGQALLVAMSAPDAALVATTREIRLVTAASSFAARTFAVEASRAAASDDGATIATFDDAGVLRVVDRATLRDVWTADLGRADAPRTLFVRAAGAAWQRRSAAIETSDGGAPCAVDGVALGDATARLVGAGPLGSFVVAGRVVGAFGWDGAERWRRRLDAPIADAAVAPDGTVLCVAGGVAQLVADDGGLAARYVAPSGRLAAVAVDDDGAPRAAFVDGRRIALVDAAGGSQWHATLPEPVTACALARQGRSVVAVAGDSLTLMETVAPDTGPESPGGVVAAPQRA